LLIGSYTHAMDGKNRVFIPVAYRAILGDRFVMNRSPEKRCLFIWPLDKWEKFQTEPMLLPMDDEDNRAKVRFYLKEANVCEPDGQGRIVIPQKQKDRIGLVRDVTFIGVGNGIEVWSPEQVPEDDDDDTYERLQARKRPS